MNWWQYHKKMQRIMVIDCNYAIFLDPLCRPKIIEITSIYVWWLQINFDILNSKLFMFSHGSRPCGTQTFRGDFPTRASMPGLRWCRPFRTKKNEQNAWKPGLYRENSHPIESPSFSISLKTFIKLYRNLFQNVSLCAWSLFLDSAGFRDWICEWIRLDLEDFRFCYEWRHWI